MHSDAIACGMFESLGKDARYYLTKCCHKKFGETCTDLGNTIITHIA